MRAFMFVMLLCLLVACGGSGDGATGEDETDLPPPAAEPTDGMTFEEQSPNAFVPTAEDALSTFAVDVDTGSYTMARRYVTDGVRPPAASVRVEEFVNFFEQGYAAPTEESFAVHVDGAATPYTTQPDHRLLRVGLQSRTAQEATRRRAALTFVVDVSGSMAEQNRLGLVRDSLRLLVENLRADDTVAIVTYGGRANVVLHPTPANEVDAITAAIDTLRPGGSTNAEAGLRLGYRLAREALQPGDINRVVLASDGVANVGVADPEGLLEAIRRDAEVGIQLVSVGVGMGNFNDVLMEQLADNGDGFYAYVDSFHEAQRIFSRELTSTLDVVGLDTKIQVQFLPEVVTGYRLVGFENRAVADRAFRDDSVDAGAVGPGHTVTALYEIALDPDAGRDAEVGEVRVRWTDPATGGPKELAQPVRAGAMATPYAQAHPRLRLDATVAAYAEVLRNSRYGRGLSLAVLAEDAREVAGEVPDDKAVAEFAQLVSTAAALSP